MAIHIGTVVPIILLRFLDSNYKIMPLEIIKKGCWTVELS